MSYILEALKKADRERAAGHVPDLETVHLREPTAQKSYRWLWILAALFIFNGLLVGLLATRNAGKPGEGELAGRMAPDDRGFSLPDSARVQTTPETAPPVRKPLSGIVRTTPQIPARPRDVASKPASPHLEPAPVQDQTAAAPVSVVEPPALIADATLAPAPSAVPKVTSAPGKIPEWDDLSLEFRSGFSMPRMDVHVYDTDPQRRFVLIDLQKFREGDRLPNGAVIEKILPDGIQLSFQGTRFHYTK
jgi:general secretion pathway protein B